MSDFLLKQAVEIQNYFASNVFAATSTSENTIDLKTMNPLGDCGDIFCLVDVILKAIRIASVPFVVGFIIYGAFLILTAGAKPDNFKKGRAVITWAIVGFIIILAASTISSLIMDLLTGPPATS